MTSLEHSLYSSNVVGRCLCVRGGGYGESVCV